MGVRRVTEDGVPVLWTRDVGVDQKEVVSPGIPPGVLCSKQSMLMVCRTRNSISHHHNQPNCNHASRVTQYLPAWKHWTHWKAERVKGLLPAPPFIPSKVTSLTGGDNDWLDGAGSPSVGGGHGRAPLRCTRSGHELRLERWLATGTVEAMGLLQARTNLSFKL